ncbi:MAG: RsmB/NOP family class I SAM-dependent RNA methyltransferase [Bradymonadaceae bacterium]
MTNKELLHRYRPIIDDWDGFLAALDRSLPLCVWTNTLRTDAASVQSSLGAAGLEPTPVDWHPGAFRLHTDLKPGNRFEYVAGLYHVQEEASLLPVQILDPQPGERILDACAAPGNKTVQIAVRMENKGTIVANDRDYRRSKATSRATDRLGVFNTTITTYDAANYPGEAGHFDRVLADVPCSCEGTSRKNPEIFQKLAGQDPGRLQGLQQAILRKAVQLTRPGGRIVYSTCTYAPEENEAVIDAVLGQFGDELRLLPARIEGFACAPGLTRWQDQDYDPSLTAAMRVYPHHNDTGGFFVALLEKRSSHE